MVLNLVSCDQVTSFSYDGKKARDVGLTCSCNLGNIMPDSIFYQSMKQEINFSVFVCMYVCAWVCVCVCVCVCVRPCVFV